MKIRSVKISNILSFTHHTNIDDAPEARFENGINILVGPNGSGKSSFLEVLNQVMQRFLFSPCVYNKHLLDDLINQRSVLAGEDAGELAHLSRHWDSSDKNLFVRVTVSFNERDFSNMSFIQENRESFNALFKDYCNDEAVQIPAFTDNLIISNTENIIIDFVSTNGKRFTKTIRNSDGEPIDSGREIFLQFYLERFEFLQKAILLNNDLVNNGVRTQKWIFLYRTFGIVGCYRNYNAIVPIHDIDEKGEISYMHEKNKDLRNENTRTADTGESRLFVLAKAKLSYRYHRIFNDYGQSEIDSKILTDNLFSEINDWLSEYLQLKLIVKRPNKDKLQQRLYFSKIKDGKNLEISDLSSGEKGLFYFIMAFIAYDLRSGLMIIDEPELHLHPQAQKHILSLLSYLTKEWDTQFIIATHSPIFVTTDTIKNVKRFDIKNYATQIFQQSTTEEDKHLVRILTYTNSSKVFFAKRTVLVEGECDEYFYRYYFDDFEKRKKEETDGKERTFDVEFLSITGTGERERWEAFLKGFGVDVYFIGDWDNVINLGIISQEKFDAVKLNFYKKISEKIDESLKDKKSEDGKELLKKIDAFIKDPSDQNKAEIAGIRDYLYKRHTPWSSIVAYWRASDPNSFNTMITDIEKKYANNLFILKEGVLEDYLKIEDRCHLSSVIVFCKQEFDNWKSDIKYQERVAELNEIFNHITK